MSSDFWVSVRVTAGLLEDVSEKEIRESIQELLDTWDGGAATIFDVVEEK